MIVKSVKTELCEDCHQQITLREYEGIGGVWSEHFCGEEARVNAKDKPREDNPHRA